MQFNKGLKTPRRVNVEQFRTMILEAVSLVNDRPLGPDANWDREGISNVCHVSPNKLIHGRSSRIVPVNMTLKETMEQGMNVGLLYKHRKKVLNLFWNEFKANYLRSLKFTQKWFNQFNQEIEAGTLVHYHDQAHMKPGHSVIFHTLGRRRVLKLMMHH